MLIKAGLNLKKNNNPTRPKWGQTILANKDYKQMQKNNF